MSYLCHTLGFRVAPFLTKDFKLIILFSAVLISSDIQNTRPDNNKSVSQAHLKDVPVNKPSSTLTQYSQVVSIQDNPVTPSTTTAVTFPICFLQTVTVGNKDSCLKAPCTPLLPSMTPCSGKLMSERNTFCNNNNASPPLPSS